VLAIYALPGALGAMRPLIAERAGAQSV
jgi:hypothetical protein